MRFLPWHACAAAASVLLTGCQQTELSRRSGLEGAWRVAEAGASADAPGTAAVQPGVYIFLQRHYSLMYVPGSGARVPFLGAEPTDAEKIAAYDSFIGNTGTYELRDSLLVIRPMVARSPSYMVIGADTLVYRVSADTLWLSARTAAPNDPARVRKLLRIE